MGESVKCAHCKTPMQPIPRTLDGEEFITYAACPRPGCQPKPHEPRPYIYQGRVYPGGDKA